jgi:mono/diheme cytochrome c family protein
LCIALLACGCGRYDAVFVYSKQTNDLMPAAAETVQAALDDRFGNPQELVAWQKLPVDYGTNTGVVAESDENTALRFRANLEASEGGTPADAAALKGSGLLWTSGPLAGLTYELEGQTLPFDFTVTGYDPKTQFLTVEPHPRSEDFESQALEAGSQFTIAGPVLKHGRKLYMTHCMHCHGVSGDGDGPTAKYLNPLPRDYRLGVFKFTSTLSTEKIRRDDFERIVRNGLPGTYMPSFMLLEDAELHAIVEYVRWLSMRGEMEQKLAVEMKAGGYTKEALEQRVSQGETEQKIGEELAAYIENDFPLAAEGAADILATNWVNAEKESSIVLPKVPRTPTDAASLARGRELYLSDRAKCATCHGPTGRGDGPETETLKQIAGSSEYYPEPGLFDSWGHKVAPRDLTRGIYRGGRRPIDLYRRVYSGIKGTPMPAFGGTVLKDEEIWDLVNYVMNLPYERDGSPGRTGSQDVAAARN